ncbi:MAG TPA: ATP-binding protein [Dissulfurispiraceae bacterium]|nr:ATP-binding protein [Dissulfurispiraceae bacterium]
MTDNPQDITLLNQAMERFNSASSAVMAYYQTLEERVRLLTEEVEHKKQLLNSILDSIDVGVVYFDGDGTVQLVNSTVERLLDTSAMALIGKNALPAAFNEQQVACAGGKAFPAIISRSEVKNEHGETTGSVLFFQDITRLKELEAENERNRRLTAMGELVTKIAHEIRNPLGSIELFASLLIKDLDGTPSASYAGRISNSVRHLVNTLDNMLRFSGGVRPFFAEVSLHAVLSELVEDFRGVFHGSRIILALHASEPFVMHADRGLLRQAFINLLLNAFQAMPDGGKIEIRLERVAEGVLIVFSDTGTGMDEGTAARLFEPFFSTKDRGTGLGMSITAGIIAAHGGRIQVRTAQGAGTAFKIGFPLEKDT